MADDLDDLQRLAPAVDADRAQAAFRRRRRRSRSMRRGGMALAAVTVLVAGTVGAVATLDHDSSPVVAGPGETVPTPSDGPVTFEVLTVARASQALGTLRSAVDEGEYVNLWTQSSTNDPRPAVDFEEQVVVSITIPGSGCEPVLTELDRDGGTITPVFVVEDQLCTRNLVARTYVVAVDRSSLGSTFTLRLLADPLHGLDEQRLEIVVPNDELPRVWRVPDGWGGEQAVLGGVLSYDADLDCFFLAGHTQAVVWPGGTEGTTDGPGVVLPGGAVIRDGDSFRGGGGGHGREEADVFGIAPECVTDQIAVIQFADVEVTPSVNAGLPEPTCAAIEAFVASVPDRRPLSDYTSSESPEQLLADADLVVHGELTGVVGVDESSVLPSLTYEVEYDAAFKYPAGSITARVLTVAVPSPGPVSDEEAADLQGAAVAGIPVVLFAYSLDVRPGFTIGIEGLMTACPGEPPIGFVSPRPEWAEVETLDDLTRRIEQAAPP